jgi:hypothetical protein
LRTQKMGGAGLRSSEAQPEELSGATTSIVTTSDRPLREVGAVIEIGNGGKSEPTTL